MPERGSKRNKGHPESPDEVVKASHDEDVAEKPGSKKWRIKSSCTWLIPGDVPGQRRMPVAPPSPPAPLTLLPFKPKPVKPVQINTHTASHTVSSSSVSKPATSDTDIQIDKAEINDKQHTQAVAKDALTADDNGSAGGKGSVEDQGIPVEVLIADDTDRRSKSTTSVKQSLANAKASESLIKQSSQVGLSTDADTSTSSSSVETVTGNDVNGTVSSVAGSASRDQLESAGQSYTHTQATLVDASHGIFTDQMREDDQRSYRKFLPLLLLLLLMAGLGGVAVDYFFNRDENTRMAVIQPMTGALSPIETSRIELSQPVATEVTENTIPVVETTSRLPVVEISMSSLEHEAIGGIRMMTHIVIRGDTLWDISKSYLNNPFRYPELARLSSIKNPDLIYPGDIVHIHIKVEH